MTNTYQENYDVGKFNAHYIDLFFNYYTCSYY